MTKKERATATETKTMFFSILLPYPPHLLLPRKTPTTTILKQIPKPLSSIRCSTSSFSSSPSLSTQFDLKTYWTTLIGEINKKLDEAIPVQYPEKIYEAMRYSVLAKAAKRAPPVMCVAACELFGGNRLAAFPTACALEMVTFNSLLLLFLFVFWLFEPNLQLGFWVFAYITIGSFGLLLLFFGFLS